MFNLHISVMAPLALSVPSALYGAGHLVTATFGQWPIWSDEVKFFQKDFV